MRVRSVSLSTVSIIRCMSILKMLRRLIIYYYICARYSAILIFDKCKQDPFFYKCEYLFIYYFIYLWQKFIICDIKSFFIINTACKQIFCYKFY